ncbi:cytochrome P450 4V2 [Aphelenchoides avenae]|nr:cytochrome P450 4V2 [Aphelenchus avenae]
MSLLKPVRHADFFSKKYFESIVKECPKLANCNGEPLNDYMLAVLAFNLAYNAFYRGERRTASKLLSSVLNSENLSDEVRRAASLLEIQICIELNRQNNHKQAQDLLLALTRHPAWSRATSQQLDCFELLSARARSRHYQQPTGRSDTLHWFLFDCEIELKSGDARAALNKMLQRRNTAQPHERILLDNAIGCVYAIAFKDCNMAESYFRSALVNDISPKDVIPVRPSTLVYHTALAQLGSGKPKSAFSLFLAVWPFYHDNPRTWLRVAECCVQGTSSSDAFAPNEAIQRAADQGWRTIQKLSSPKCIQKPTEATCSPSFAVYAIHQALSIALAHKDFSYLLPYLYSLYAFAYIQLKRWKAWCTWTDCQKRQHA